MAPPSIWGGDPQPSNSIWTLPTTQDHTIKDKNHQPWTLTGNQDQSFKEKDHQLWTTNQDQHLNDKDPWTHYRPEDQFWSLSREDQTVNKDPFNPKQEPSSPHPTQELSFTFQQI